MVVKRKISDVRELVGQKVERIFEFERSTIDVENRTIELSFASPYPVDRWWGREILEISTKAIRTRRLDAGAPLLVNHNRDDQVAAVVEGSFRVDAAKQRSYVKVKFSRSQRGEEIWQDVLDGIRRNTSVGYIIHNATLTNRSDSDGDTYLVDDWEPYEITLASVPADPDVGVGRSEPEKTPEDTGTPPVQHRIVQPPAGAVPAKQTEGRHMEPDENGTTTTAAAPAATAPAAPAQRSAAATNDRRALELLELGIKFGAVDAARDAIASGTSVGDFQRSLLDKIGTSKPLSTGERTLGLSAKEKQNYSILRVVRALAEPTNRKVQEEAAFELDAHRALADSGMKTRGGILVPDDVLQDRAWSPFNTQTDAGDTGDTGGKIVANNLMSGSFIDMLMARTWLLRRARLMTGMKGTFDIPKKLTRGSAAWIGEDSAAPQTGMTVGQIPMSPKTLAAENQITRRLLMQSSPSAEALVRADLVEASALAIDLAGLYGDPSSDTNSPRGLKFQSGINTKDFAAVQPTYAELVDMETKIAADNADVEAMLYILSATTRGALKTTQKFEDTNGAPVWEPGNTVNGYGTEVSNQVAGGDVFMGNFSDFIVAMWGGFEIFADPYSESSKGRLKLVTFQDVDFAVRRAESFCYGVKPA